MKLTLLSAITAGLMCMLPIPAALAQTYPAKPVRVIVPTTPGGAADVQARLLARQLTENLKQSFFIDNRPGASGIIGAAVVAKSPPDGHTLLVTTSLLAITPAMYRKVQFDPLQDFATVSQLTSAPQMMVAHPSVPAKTPAEFIALAKRFPGKLNAASAGSGSVNRLVLEMLKDAAGIDFVHVPFKSGSLATGALIAGEVDFLFTGLVTATPLVRTGKLRPIAVTSLKPLPLLPEVPTLASLYPGFESANWYALFAPAGTPEAVIRTLHTATVRALKMPEMRDFVTGQGADTVGSSPQDFAAHFRNEVTRYARIVKAANLQVD